MTHKQTVRIITRLKHVTFVAKKTAPFMPLWMKACIRHALFFRVGWIKTQSEVWSGERGMPA